MPTSSSRFFAILTLLRFEARIRRIADREDHRIRQDGEVAVRRLEGDVIFPDRRDRGIQISRHPMIAQQFPQHGGIGHTDAARADQMTRHLDDDRMFPL